MTFKIIKETHRSSDEVIIVAESLEELAMKAERKTGGAGIELSDDMGIDFGLDDSGGGLL